MRYVTPQKSEDLIVNNCLYFEMLTAISFNCIAFTLNTGINQFLIMEAVTSSENFLQNMLSVHAIATDLPRKSYYGCRCTKELPTSVNVCKII